MLSNKILYSVACALVDKTSAIKTKNLTRRIISPSKVAEFLTLPLVLGKRGWYIFVLMSDNFSTLTPSLPSLISQTEETTALPRPPRSSLFYTALQRFVGRVLLLPFGGFLVALMKFAGYRIE